MAYRQPGVTVYQNFTGVTPQLALFALPNVNVGPAFQVVAPTLAGTYTGGLQTYSYPSQIAGTIVDTRPPSTDLIDYAVAINLHNVVISFITSTNGVVSGGNLTQITSATTNVFQNVLAGDVIVVTGSLNGNNGNYTVREVVDNNTLNTNETFAAAETNLNFTVRRNLQATIGTINIPTSTTGVVVATTGVTLPAGLSYTHPTLGSHTILSADVYLSYRALRLEKSAEVTEYTSVSDLQADFGIDQIVPENPLAFAAYLALNNLTLNTNILACNFNFFTDEVLCYTGAFEILELTDMYAINVLTQNTAVHTSLKSHCELMSQPQNKLERVGICNRQIILTAVVVPSITTGGSEGLNGTGNVNLTSAASHFLTDGAVPGMYVHVTAPSGAVGRFKIASVNSQTSITLATGPTGGPYTGVTFYIDKDLSKNDQATYISGYASSIGSRRLVLTWPDVVKIPAGSTIRELPGYFLGCAVGSMTTGLPTQQGFTNQSVSVYTGVVHSTKYFTNDQLNTMANGGVMIFVQAILDVTALYIRHQLTTDRSAIKFQEYSITKNVDFIAKFIRDNHKQFPGKYNIVDNAFDDLKTNAAGIIAYLRDDTKLPKIGGVIRSGKLVSVEQDLANIDTIIEQWNLDIPIPLNNLDITINV
jgi:hypothetical protein